MRTNNVYTNNFESMFADFDRLLKGAPVAKQAFLPSYELNEDKRGYLLSFDVPGVPKDAIKIEVKDQQLKLWGERKRDETFGNASVFTEKRYGRFERVFTLPADVDADKIQAHHQDGVLTLMLPKAEKAQAKTIKIESDPSGFFNRVIGDDGKVN